MSTLRFTLAYLIAPLVAGLTWWLLGILTPLRGGSGFLDVHSHLDWLRGVLWPYGPLAALVASLLWLMARFERTGSQGAMSMNKLIVAFLIAPLAIPAIAFRLWEMRPLSVPDLAAIFLNSVITYAGIFLFGIPAYLFLRARKWTTFWAAAVGGFIVAGLTSWLLGIVTSFLGGWDLLDVHVHLAWLRFALWPCGPLGALVASLLWLVTRPDRAGKPPKIISMARPIIAFLVAPLAVPLFVAVDMYPLLSTPFVVRVVLYLSILTAYVGTFVFGIPAYLLLRARKWTALWLAPVIGFMGGALGWWLFLAVPWTGNSFRFEPVWNLSWLRDVLWPYGPLGALVGTLLWFIARPDRADSDDRVPGEQREPTPPNA